ncbi:MAG: phosphatase PAP2 family protein, partial [bacterium]|nr:phosphatase PAP2 family protein [bacterium]
MNEELFLWLNSLAINYPLLDSVFRFLANDFGLLVIFILGLFLLEHKDKKRGKQETAMIVVVAIIAWFVAHFLKDFFNSERPFVVLNDVKNLFPSETGHAFPSGHATFYSALAMMMWFYHKRIGYALGVVALIIG